MAGIAALAVFVLWALAFLLATVWFSTPDTFSRQLPRLLMMSGAATVLILSVFAVAVVALQSIGIQEVLRMPLPTIASD